jgi:diguanylate cyclase (GGDEF)-like protein
MALTENRLYDTLTGLATTALFKDRLEMALNRARRNSCSAVLILVDMGIERLSDSGHGRDAVNAVQVEIAGRLKTSLRATDTIGRVSPEHIGIVLEDMLVPGNVVTVAEKVMAQLQNPVSLDGRPTELKVSIGVALFPQCATTIETLYQRANTALGWALKRRGNAYEIFEGNEAAARRA